MGSTAASMGSTVADRGGTQQAAAVWAVPRSAVCWPLLFCKNRGAMRQKGPLMLQAFELGTSVLAQSDQDAAIAAGILGMGVAIFAVVALAALLISAVIIWLVWDAYRVLPASAQKLPANLLWLGLIPCLGIIMQLLMAILVPLAFKDAFAARGRTDVGDCGLVLGICWAAGIVGSFVPFLGFIFALGSLVCMVLLIIKLRQLKGVWQSMGPAQPAPTWG
jgi:uncharacterized membrane protein YqjE